MKNKTQPDYEMFDRRGIELTNEFKLSANPSRTKKMDLKQLKEILHMLKDVK